MDAFGSKRKEKHCEGAEPGDGNGKSSKKKDKKMRMQSMAANNGASMADDEPAIIDYGKHKKTGEGFGGSGSEHGEEKRKNKKQRQTVEGARGLEEGKDDQLPSSKGKDKESALNGGGRGATMAEESVDVKVSGSGWEKMPPVATFAEAPLPEILMGVCKGFSRPSPIQSHSWPVLVEGRDLIGIAKTGSGKTLAFGLPGLAHCLNKSKGTKKAKQKGGNSNAVCRPSCLVLAPTRELAQQSAGVFEEAGKACNVGSACIYGGASKGHQRGLLEALPEVIVATPGRLLDFAEEGAIDLGSVTFLVLDEADRMLDMGFEPAIRAIMGMVPKERQTVMLSATWPPGVGQMAAQYLRDPIKVTIGSEDLAANHDVTQKVEVLDEKARDARLDALLRICHKSRTNRVLVFVLYKKEADRVETMLRNRGWSVAGIHGDKSQDVRNKAVAQFKSGTLPLLVATDVAARGLDIPNVEYVINYSFPLTTEDYVHRIGRTGRAGNKGTAYTFFTNNDRVRAGELINILKEANQHVPEDLLKFGTHVKKKESKLYGAHFKVLTADAPKAKKITFDSDDE